MKEKSILKELRTIRENISNELKGKTTEQIIEYFKQKKTLHPASWQ